MSETDFETRLAGLLRERGEHAVEPFDPVTVAEAAIEGAQQRGPMTGLRRIFQMMTHLSRPARYGLATGALAIALVGGGIVYVGSQPTQPSGTSPSPTETPAPTQTARPTVAVTPAPTPILGEQSLFAAPYTLPAGTYYLDNPYPARIVFDVGNLWKADPVSEDGLGLGVGVPDLGWGVTFALVGAVSADPWNPEAGTLDSSIAASAEDLVAAFTSWSGFTTTTEQLTVGGFPATRIELTRTDDHAACTTAVLFTTPLLGKIEARPGRVSHLFQLTVVDIDGTPLVIRTTDYPEWTEFAECDPGNPNPPSNALHLTMQPKLRALLDSIEITPR